MELKAGANRTTLRAIPTGWDVKPLRAFCTDVLDCHHSTPVWTENGPVVIRNQNIRDGKLDLSNASFTDETHFAERTRRAVPTSEDIVITREAPMGLVCMVPSGLRCCLGQRMVLLRINRDAAEPRFVHRALLSEAVQRAIAIAGGSGSTVSNLRIPVLEALQILAPKRDEQRVIANALSDVDALIDALDRLIAKKRDIKQAAMQQLLTGQTRLPGFTCSWDVKRLGDVASLNRLNVNPASWPSQMFVHFSLPAFDEGKSPIVELGSAIGSNKFRVPQGAVLVSKLNPRIPRVWAPDEIPEDSVASTEFLVLISKVGVSRQFLFILCASPRFCEQMELAATGTTGSHQRISPSGALTLKVFVPSDPDEQTAIADVLSDMDAELAALERRRDKTRALKQGMMQELLTGRIRLVSSEKASA